MKDRLERIRRPLIILIVALVCCGITTASAGAVTKKRATKVGEDRAFWKAACGQGYWNCSKKFISESVGRVGFVRNPQWLFELDFIRYTSAHNGHGYQQEACYFKMEINFNGSTYKKSMYLTCGPPSDPGGDTPILP
jgi:hypothetical protein